MKSVLISIKPEWCSLIASGKKTVEVRKTRPKLETPFKVYIYCTQGREQKALFKALGYKHIPFSSKVVIGEFVCDNIECFTTDYRRDELQTDRMVEASCVGYFDLCEYEEGSRCLYGWHISNLVIYDEPKELGEFKKVPNGANEYRQEFLGKDFCIKYYSDLKVTRPPQSWCYVDGVR